MEDFQLPLFIIIVTCSVLIGLTYIISIYKSIIKRLNEECQELTDMLTQMRQLNTTLTLRNEDLKHTVSRLLAEPRKNVRNNV